VRKALPLTPDPHQNSNPPPFPHPNTITTCFEAKQTLTGLQDSKSGDIGATQLAQE
jgi:hypothetical protein